MRTILTFLFVFVICFSSSYAASDTSPMSVSTNLSSSLSGSTSAGFDFAAIPKSAAYGVLGAGFLVLTVLRRRNSAGRIDKNSR